MTASELALRLRPRLLALEADARKAGFDQIVQGVIDHSDIHEVVGFSARRSDPRGFYDGLSLRIAFITFPRPCVYFRLEWTSWMADPRMKIRANYPPVVLGEKTVANPDDPAIQPLAGRFLSRLAAELARGREPGLIERLWIRLAG